MISFKFLTLFIVTFSLTVSASDQTNTVTKTLENTPKTTAPSNTTHSKGFKKELAKKKLFILQAKQYSIRLEVLRDLMNNNLTPSLSFLKTNISACAKLKKELINAYLETFSAPPLGLPRLKQKPEHTPSSHIKSMIAVAKDQQRIQKSIAQWEKWIAQSPHSTHKEAPKFSWPDKKRYRSYQKFFSDHAKLLHSCFQKCFTPALTPKQREQFSLVRQLLTLPPNKMLQCQSEFNTFKNEFQKMCQHFGPYKYARPESVTFTRTHPYGHILPEIYEPKLAPKKDDRCERLFLNIECSAGKMPHINVRQNNPLCSTLEQHSLRKNYRYHYLLLEKNPSTQTHPFLPWPKTQQEIEKSLKHLKAIQILRARMDFRSILNRIARSQLTRLASLSCLNKGHIFDYSTRPAEGGAKDKIRWDEIPQSFRKQIEIQKTQQQ